MNTKPAVKPKRRRKVTAIAARVKATMTMHGSIYSGPDRYQDGQYARRVAKLAAERAAAAKAKVTA